MNDEDALTLLVELRDMLHESGATHIAPATWDDDSDREDDGAPAPRAELLRLFVELRSVLVDAPTMAAALMHDLEADRITFVDEPDETASDVEFIRKPLSIDSESLMRWKELAAEAHDVLDELEALLRD